MEIFELRYFLGVARFENIHRAADQLNVSPASLSKAVSRLEEELAVSLFSREGRGIRLTDHGRLLQVKGSEIVQLEEAARLTLGGHLGQIQAVIAGSEVLLAEMGMAIVKEVQKRFPAGSFELRHADDETALKQVARGEVHLALVTSDPKTYQLESRIISDPHFYTYVGKSHALYPAARVGKTLPVEKILEHSFASPSQPLLGQVGAKQSLDGWRDDQFPRKVDFLTSSLKLLEEFAIRGSALVYLPDYYGDRLPLLRLKISGCPYTCTQKVRLAARNPKAVGWINSLF
jgi:DNA-binding transcriptional LysR family regulator